MDAMNNVCVVPDDRCGRTTATSGIARAHRGMKEELLSAKLVILLQHS